MDENLHQVLEGLRGEVDFLAVMLPKLKNDFREAQILIDENAALLDEVETAELLNEISFRLRNLEERSAALQNILSEAIASCPDKIVPGRETCIKTHRQPGPLQRPQHQKRYLRHQVPAGELIDKKFSGPEKPRLLRNDESSSESDDNLSNDDFDVEDGSSEDSTDVAETVGNAVQKQKSPPRKDVDHRKPSNGNVGCDSSTSLDEWTTTASDEEATTETSDTSFESDSGQDDSKRSLVDGFLRMFSFRSGFPLTTPSWMWFKK